MKRLLDVDPLSGMKTWHDFDAATETTIITYEQDVEPLLDACKHDMNHADRKLGDGAHVASIPPSVQMKWLVELGVDCFNPDHRKAVNRLLDGDYKHLKRLPVMLGRY
jgi:hypothetical protein